MSPALVLCVAEILTMVGAFAFPALLPGFQAEWGLSNTQAGWISGLYFAGYALAVPVLTALTDRMDAKRIYLAGAAMAALGGLGFAWLAEGFWTALAFRVLAGMGLAGTYMPGLKALVDRLQTTDRGQARALSFYTASFSIGTALSFLVIGEVARTWDWRTAFAVGGACALAGLALAATLRPVAPQAMPPLPSGTNAPPARLLDFRPVFRNRRAMGYVLGYATHMWELFALRTWMVAFLGFALMQDGSGGMDPTLAASYCAMVAMLGSLVGADLAARFDRPKVIAVSMVLSALIALGFGASAASLPYGAVIALAFFYNFAVQLDSAALTTGAVLMADPGRRGATIAVHSLIGFTAAFLGPLAFGMVLDGIGQTAQGWWLAFASVGLIALAGPFAMHLCRSPCGHPKDRA